MGHDDLIRRARLAVAGKGAVDLTRLSGGMSHDLFVTDDRAGVVVKVFRTSADHEPEREWDALQALAGSGLAPEPIHFDRSGAPVIVMTFVPGAPKAGRELRLDDAHRIGAAHRAVHRTVAPSPRPLGHTGLRSAAAALFDDRPQPEVDRGDVVRAAWSAARRWIATNDVDRLLSSGPRHLTRGDPNLRNYLWTDEDGLVLVDWENSGSGDAVLELADMAEHAGSHDVPEPFWSELADATGLSPAERAQVRPARRLFACFWLVLIERRRRAGLPTTLTAEEQAARTLAVLDGP